MSFWSVKSSLYLKERCIDAADLMSMWIDGLPSPGCKTYAVLWFTGLVKARESAVVAASSYLLRGNQICR